MPHQRTHSSFSVGKVSHGHFDTNYISNDSVVATEGWCLSHLLGDCCCTLVSKDRAATLEPPAGKSPSEKTDQSMRPTLFCSCTTCRKFGGRITHMAPSLYFRKLRSDMVHRSLCQSFFSLHPITQHGGAGKLPSEAV